MRIAQRLNWARAAKALPGRGGSARRGGAVIAAPLPRFAGGDEADFGHQPLERVGVEPEAGGERMVDRVVALVRLDVVGVGGEAVGEVDAQPGRAEAAEAERGAARIGAAVERRGGLRGQARHGQARRGC